MKILFICTHNRCRSILAEALTNHIAKGLIVARSAGSQPVGEVHPLSLKYLSERGVDIEGLSSQSWFDYESWQPDVVITVCDSAAGESCPLWFGQTIRVHWGLPDPSRVEGSEEDIKNAFYKVMETLENRINHLMSIGIHQKDKVQMEAILKEMGSF